jgi:hypothetical protein
MRMSKTRNMERDREDKNTRHLPYEFCLPENAGFPPNVTHSWGLGALRPPINCHLSGAEQTCCAVHVQEKASSSLRSQ